MQPKTLVFATHNPHKAREVQQIVGDRYRICTLTDIGCREEIPETASTIEGNAQIKARYVKEKYGYDCFSEDTGLEVVALGGAPGVHTARYAGAARDANANNTLLLQQLAGKKNRKAQFRTVICLILNGKEHLLEGICQGKIHTAPRGTGGFGYDPIFIPKGRRKTFAELGDAIKNKISHRAKATRLLLEVLSCETPAR